MPGRSVTPSKQLSWEHAYFPTYYFHPSDVPEKFLRYPKRSEKSITYDLVVAERIAEEAVTVHNDGNLKDLVKITFDKVDAWLEEDEEIHGHPKDPYKVRNTLPFVSQFSYQADVLLSPRE